MAYLNRPWCPPGGYSAQAIKEYIDYELKCADNPYILTDFFKLLSLTYYSLTAYKVWYFALFLAPLTMI